MSIENTMIEFKSLDKFVIEGRGDVFVVENNRDRKCNFEDLYPKVKIDENEYELIGVECQGVTQRKGCKLGLLIGEKNEN